MVDFSKDMIHLLHPDERLRFTIVDSYAFAIRINQLSDAGERPSSDPFSSQFCKPAFNHIHLRRIGRREEELETRVIGQPLFYCRMIMRSVVIQDQMEIEPAGSRAVNRLQ